MYQARMHWFQKGVLVWPSRQSKMQGALDTDKIVIFQHSKYAWIGWMKVSANNGTHNHTILILMFRDTKFIWDYKNWGFCWTPCVQACVCMYIKSRIATYYSPVWIIRHIATYYSPECFHSGLYVVPMPPACMLPGVQVTTGMDCSSI